MRVQPGSAGVNAQPLTLWQDNSEAHLTWFLQGSPGGLSPVAYSREQHSDMVCGDPSFCPCITLPTRHFCSLASPGNKLRSLPQVMIWGQINTLIQMF